MLHCRLVVALTAQDVWADQVMQDTAYQPRALAHALRSSYTLLS